MNPSELELQQEQIEVAKYYQLGVAKLNENKHIEAIDLFTKSIDASKYILALNSYMGRALCYMITKKYQEAIKDYTNPLFNINKNRFADIQRFTNIGYAFYNLGNYKEAVLYYEKVLELDPFDNDAKLMLNKLKN